MPLTPAMPVIPRTEKSSNNLSVVLEDLGEFCYGNTIPGFHEISVPLWSRGQETQDTFLVILGLRDRATSHAIV